MTSRLLVTMIMFVIASLSTPYVAASEKSMILVQPKPAKFTNNEKVAIQRKAGKPYLASVIKDLKDGQWQIRSGDQLFTINESDMLKEVIETDDYQTGVRVHVIEKGQIYIGTVVSVFEKRWLEIHFDGYVRHEMHLIEALASFDEITHFQLSDLEQAHIGNEKVSAELAVVRKKLFPPELSSPKVRESKEKEVCDICLETVENPDREIRCSSCQRVSHFDECVSPWLLQVNHLETARGYRCVNPKCKHPYSFKDLGRNKVLAQRTLIAALDLTSTLIPCFKCSAGIIVAEFSDMGFKFQNPCPKCNFSACHRCGFLHPTTTCVSSKKKITGEDINVLIKTYGKENVGGCPRCNQIIIKNDGCPDMICGQSFHDERSEKHPHILGCGNRFRWETRLLPQQLKKKTKTSRSCVIL